MLKLVAFAALSLMSAAAASGQEAGTASGSLMLDAAPTMVSHAYASEITDVPETLPEGSPATHVKILLLDRELESGSRAYRVVAGLGRQDRLRGLVLDIDPAGAKLLRAELVGHLPGPPQFFIDYGGTPAPAALQDLAFANGRLSGRAVTAQAQEVFMFDPPADAPKSWSFDVRFDVPVLPAPALVAILEGAAALASEPGQAFRAYLDALDAGDAAAARGSFAAGHPAIADTAPLDIGLLRAGVLQSLADAAALLALPIKIYVFEGHADLLIERDYGWHPHPLVLDGGRWKLDF